jgi:hypothetical protein
MLNLNAYTISPPWSEMETKSSPKCSHENFTKKDASA